MKDDEYIRFCPEHGMMEDPVPVCGKCGQETLVSAMTYGQWQEYRASKEEPERFFPGTLEVAFKKPLEKIISDIRSGKKGRAEPSIKLLSWRPEREQYIADVIAWRDTLRGYAVPLFMSHCSYESIRPYLDFKDYISMDPYLVKVYWPYFLEHYKGRRPLACEECKSETNRLFIKIVSEKKEVSAVRRGGWVVRNFQFTAHPVPHALCDTCMLKKASKRKKLKGL